MYVYHTTVSNLQYRQSWTIPHDVSWLNHVHYFRLSHPNPSIPVVIIAVNIILTTHHLSVHAVASGKYLGARRLAAYPPDSGIRMADPVMLLRNKCYMLIVEWQKRGLSHCHTLFWLDSKIQPDQFDKIIVLKLPKKDEDPVLFDIATKNMVHRPCVEESLTSLCMTNGICLTKYSRRFVTKIQTGEDWYPVYRRRDINKGRQVTTLSIWERMINIGNRWIIPYPPILCRSFNVEYFHSVQDIKYICKYINKGFFRVRNAYDEVENYLNRQYIRKSKALWRILEFPVHNRHPTIVHLAVHLEKEQWVYFSAKNI